MLEIDGLKISYSELGEGKPIIFLHGWGASKETFEEIAKELNYHSYLIDLPGFGESEEPKKRFNLDYYVRILALFIEKKHITEPILVGHSFGGRIAIRYAKQFPVKSMILIDSAGIRKRNLEYYIKVYMYKFCRKFHINLKTGSKDYQNASPIMKEVLKNIVEEDLKNDLKSINVRTLLIWGEKDTVTPLSDAFIMEKLIADSGLVIIPDVGHFSYLEDKKYFSLVLDSFLTSEDK